MIPEKSAERETVNITGILTSPQALLLWILPAENTLAFSTLMLVYEDVMYVPSSTSYKDAWGSFGSSTINAPRRPSQYWVATEHVGGCEYAKKGRT